MCLKRAIHQKCSASDVTVAQEHFQRSCAFSGRHAPSSRFSPPSGSFSRPKILNACHAQVPLHGVSISMCFNHQVMAPGSDWHLLWDRCVGGVVLPVALPRTTLRISEVFSGETWQGKRQSASVRNLPWRSMASIPTEPQDVRIAAPFGNMT